MTKVLVIGGSGFLGSHVADSLTLNGYEVTIFDKYPSKWINNSQWMVLGDLMDFNHLNETVAEHEVVYNFAGVADLNDAINKPIETAEINILGNLNALQASKNNSIKRFVYASSQYVYSREGGFYKCSKQSSEHFVEEFQKSYGLDFTILRYGSIYGPRSDHSNGVYRIIRSALETGKISYKGDIESMREYIHVLDASDASVQILSENYANQSVILTGHELMRVSDFLKMLSEIIDLPENNINFVDERYLSHYIRTPYAYQPKFGKKYIPKSHIDLGQGLVDLITEIDSSISDVK